jgi:hypothetical protein
MPRFENPLEYQFAAEAAAALGHAGRQLRKALDALNKYIAKEYGVTADVWQAMGPRRRNGA